jgi:hypothetical protein
LLPQFLILTSIFMALSVASLSLYAALASRAKGVLTRPDLSRVCQPGGGVDVHLLRSSHPDHASPGCIRGGRLVALSGQLGPASLPSS